MRRKPWKEDRNERTKEGKKERGQGKKVKEGSHRRKEGRKPEK